MCWAADAHDDATVAMVVAAKLRELLARDEEGRLVVRQPLLAFGQLERIIAHLGEGIVGHWVTNLLSISG